LEKIPAYVEDKDRENTESIKMEKKLSQILQNSALVFTVNPEPRFLFGMKFCYKRMEENTPTNED